MTVSRSRKAVDRQSRDSVVLGTRSYPLVAVTTSAIICRGSLPTAIRLPAPVRVMIRNGEDMLVVALVATAGRRAEEEGFMLDVEAPNPPVWPVHCRCAPA